MNPTNYTWFDPDFGLWGPNPTPKSDLLINPNFNQSEGQHDPTWPDFEPWGSNQNKFNLKTGSGSAN